MTMTTTNTPSRTSSTYSSSTSHRNPKKSASSSTRKTRSSSNSNNAYSGHPGHQIQKKIKSKNLKRSNKISKTRLEEMTTELNSQFIHQQAQGSSCPSQIHLCGSNLEAPSVCFFLLVLRCVILKLRNWSLMYSQERPLGGHPRIQRFRV